MIKIAFCDDEQSAREQLCRYADQYRMKREQQLETAAFHSPLELLAAIERGNRFDIIFLDVLMPGEDGITAAAEIRNYDSNVKLIFLTASSEFAAKSYTVGAYYYQLKPVTLENFFALMDSVVAACEQERSKSLILRCKNGISRVELGSLEYCEVIHRTLFIHLSGGKVLECSGSLDELSRQLEPFGSFLRVHRSFLVNMDFIRHLSYKAVTMCCSAELPVPRGKYQSIKDAYLAYAFRNGQVVL